jgi:hypothetical protein
MEEVTSEALQSVNDLTDEQAKHTLCAEHYQVIFMMFELDEQPKTVAQIHKQMPFLSVQQIYNIINHSKVYKDMLEKEWRPALDCDERNVQLRLNMHSGDDWCPKVPGFLGYAHILSSIKHYTKALLRAEKVREELANDKV